MEWCHVVGVVCFAVGAMLRRSTPALVFHNSQGPMKHCGAPSNATLDQIIQYVREVRKTRAYYGSWLHKCPDREWYYIIFGGPKRGSMYLKRKSSRHRQFDHLLEKKDAYELTVVSTFPWLGVAGVNRQIWDQAFTQWPTSFDGTMRPKNPKRTWDKDLGIRHMEEIGLKFKVFDDKIQPKMENMKYYKHRLYAHNFPWLKEPVTTPWHGDVDYSWKGRGDLDYSEYGAATRSVGNEFRSVWGVEGARTAPSASVAHPSASGKTTTKPTKPAKAAKAAEPNATEPKATEPKASEPKAAEPKAAEAKAAEPKAAEPKASEAAAPQGEEAPAKKTTTSKDNDKK